MIGQRKPAFLLLALLLVPMSVFSQGYLDLNGNGSKEPYEDPDLSPQRRARDLIGRMSLQQKSTQMHHRAKSVDEHGIPSYSWWEEALHGVWRSSGTQFPQNVGLAATWDPDLIREAYTAISDECRAFYNAGQKRSLNYYSPAVLGVMRDKRWQRCEESFGEDPFLISQLAATTYRAFQGIDDESGYLKVIATAKHFVSNRGPLGRDHPSAELSGPASERTTREVSFEPYKAGIREGHVGEFMSAYSGRPTGLDWNNRPCALSRLLLTDILRTEWHFDGHVTSDCDELGQLKKTRGYSSEEVISEAVKAGVDLVCGQDYAEAIVTAVGNGLLHEDYVDQAVERLFTSRFKTGEFDPSERVPYAAISMDVVASQEHTNLALRAARESIVLLKNEGNVLPLSKNLESLAIIGPAGNEAYLGGYSGNGPYKVSPYQGIRSKLNAAVTIDTAFTEDPQEGADAAGNADYAIVVLGPSPGREFVTQADLGLPEGQLEMIQAVVGTGTPTVAVLINGNPLSNLWVKENVPGIIEAWYPGMEGGNAIADVLFGDHNPCGHLPWTIPQHDHGLTYYDHQGEIRYDNTTYLWPFGFGLSYTTFEYANLSVSGGGFDAEDDSITIEVDVTNTGDRAGADVVQLYVGSRNASVPRPEKELKGFARVSLDPGETAPVSFTLKPDHIKYLDGTMQWVLEPGDYGIMIGTSCRDIVLEQTFHVTSRISLPEFHDEDMEYLEVSFVSPAYRSFVRPGENVVAEVLTDYNKTNVDSVNLYVNGHYVGSRSNPPYRWNENGEVERLTDCSGNDIALKAVAFGSDGRRAQSIITVDIMNGAPFGARIEAEDFLSQWGIHVDTSKDTGGGYAIGQIHSGDWSQYSVSVPRAGIYKMKLRLATGSSGGTIHISSGNKRIGSLAVPDSKSDGWQDWYTDSVQVALSEGNHLLRFVFGDGNGYLLNMNWFEAEFVSEATFPVQPARERGVRPTDSSPQSTIEFQLLTGTHVALKVIDIRGREVLTLISGNRPRGSYRIRVDRRSLPSGTYFYRLEAAGRTVCRRLMVLNGYKK